MRNAHVDYKPQMFLSTNPEYHHFTRHWIQDFYLDSNGLPIDSKAGHERYFVRQGNTMVWYNSRQEAEAVHGSGDATGISSFTFIPATCRDNPPLLLAQPDYISRLMSLPRIEKEKLLDGCWFSRVEASGLFRREWVEMLEFPNAKATQRVRAYDCAFTKVSEASPNPDWTRGVLMSKDKQSVYTIEDMVSMRDRVHNVEQLIFDTAEIDGQDVIISIPQDPNAQAGAYAKDLQRRLAEKGYTVRLSKPVKSKMIRFAPFASIAQAGYVKVVEAEWNKDLFEEAEVFTGLKGSRDDICDCISDCVAILNKSQEIPAFSLPDLSTAASFGFN